MAVKVLAKTMDTTTISSDKRGLASIGGACVAFGKLTRPLAFFDSRIRGPLPGPENKQVQIPQLLARGNRSPAQGGKRRGAAAGEALIGHFSVQLQIRCYTTLFALDFSWCCGQQIYWSYRPSLMLIRPPASHFPTNFSKTSNALSHPGSALTSASNRDLYSSSSSGGCCEAVVSFFLGALVRPLEGCEAGCEDGRRSGISFSRSSLCKRYSSHYFESSRT